MKFEYQLTRKDLGDYNVYYYWKNKTVSTILNVAVMSSVCLILIINISHKKLNIPAAIVCIAIGILVYLLFIQLQLRKYSKLFKENGPLLAKKQVELTEQFYSYTDEFEECKIKWRAFSKIETGKHAVYLFLDSPLAMIIPKSSFENEARVTEFINYVSDRIKANANIGLSF